MSNVDDICQISNLYIYDIILNSREINIVIIIIVKIFENE